MNTVGPIRKKLRATVAGTLLVMTAMAQAQTNPWSESYRLEAAGKYAEALSQIESVSPANELTVMRAAWLLYLPGRFADAEKRYLKALEMNPKSITALLGVQQQQMAQLRYGDAISTGQRVLQDNPWDYTAQTNNMFCEWKMSAWADLAKRAAAVSVRYPSDSSILVYWARAESARGEKKKARELYARVIDLVPGHIEGTAYNKAPF